MKIKLDGNSLRISDIFNVALNGYKVEIPEEIKKDIIDKRGKLEAQLKDYPEIKIYGTNRLHGDLKYVDVDFETLEKYQEKYIKVHNCATGKPIPKEVVRAIMVIRLNSFAKGISGMRWDTIQLMMDMLNNNVTPIILEEGSVGASGDLIPLAMIGAVMIGLDEAQAYYNDDLLPAKQALEKAGLKPTKLGAKEAMGLTNGSNFIAGFLVFACQAVENLIDNASIAGALSLEAIRGEKDAFSELINDNRPHFGQKSIAAEIRSLINNSKRISPDAQVHPFTRKDKWDVRVQDRYSFRSIPQVHGVLVDALVKLSEVLTIEINSATDNPLFAEVELNEMKSVISTEIFNKLKNNKLEKIIKGFSGANFHGQPLATVIDYLKIAITSLGLISDKRSFSLLDERLSYGLPADLALSTQDSDGGLMILQYAGAARAADNRVLSTPSSVMSLSTSANQEDYVSMGANGVLHLMKIIENTEKILAIELLCSLRGIQLTYDRLPKELQTLGEGTSKVYEFLSKNEKLKNTKDRLEDHYLRTDMEEMISIVKTGKLRKLFEK